MPTGRKRRVLVSACSAIAFLSLASANGYAADQAPPPPAPSIANVLGGIEFHAQGEAGIVGNGANPSQGLDRSGFNFGQLYTDHANTPLLNQLLITITKPIDPAASGYAFGFTGQALYGSDIRINHYLGIDAFGMAGQRNQINLVQGFVAAHLPLLTAGGVDVKLGLFVSPQGRESLDASGNPFYSHSYIDNYGTTFNHTGVLTTTHVNAALDIYVGIDTGNQTTFGATFPGNRFGDFGDPNGAPAGFIGFGLNNLLDNKLTVLALSHIGPEQSPIADPAGSRTDVRAYDDVVFTYLATDKLTSVTELNYSRDGHGTGNGAAEFLSAAQYLLYAYDHTFTLKGRVELLRDTKDFFVATPLTNAGIQMAEEGFASPSLVGPGTGTTYGAVTLGVTIQPDTPKPLTLVQFRPEIRYDRVIAGAPLFGAKSENHLFNGSRNQFTFGGDVVIGF